MEPVAFFAGAIGALGGAIAVIALRNPFYSVLALVIHLFSLAGLFLLLHAEFVAAAQIVVYAGAIVVLYVFVAAYVGGADEPMWEPIAGQRLLAPMIGDFLFVELAIAILGSSLQGDAQPGPNHPDRLRRAERRSAGCCWSGFFFFEVTSLLLLVAAVGAVLLAGRRREEKASVDHRPVVRRPLRAAVRHRGGRRADPPQPAGDPAVPRADAQRRQPRPDLVAPACSATSRAVFAIVVMVVAACEVVVGLGLIVAVYRRRIPLNVDDLRELRG